MRDARCAIINDISRRGVNRIMYLGSPQYGEFLPKGNIILTAGAGLRCQGRKVSYDMSVHANHVIRNPPIHDPSITTTHFWQT